MSTVIQFILALPQIISFLRDMIKLFNKTKKDFVENKHQDAVQKMDDAKTEEEIKNAQKDLAKHP